MEFLALCVKGFLAKLTFQLTKQFLWEKEQTQPSAMWIIILNTMDWENSMHVFMLTTAPAKTKTIIFSGTWLTELISYSGTLSLALIGALPCLRKLTK